MTRLLLDTHTLLWWLMGREQLSLDAFETISAPGSDVLVSAASMWEISIKRGTSRLKAPPDLLRYVEAEDFTELPIRMVHADLAGSLPPHHRDPFDRILVAQAIVEDLTVVTRDQAFADYGIPILEA